MGLRRCSIEALRKPRVGTAPRPVLFLDRGGDEPLISDCRPRVSPIPVAGSHHSAHDGQCWLREGRRITERTGRRRVGARPVLPALGGNGRATQRRRKTLSGRVVCRAARRGTPAPVDSSAITAPCVPGSASPLAEAAPRGRGCLGERFRECPLVLRRPPRPAAITPRKFHRAQISSGALTSRRDRRSRRCTPTTRRGDSCGKERER